MTCWAKEGPGAWLPSMDIAWTPGINNRVRSGTRRGSSIGIKVYGEMILSFSFSNWASCLHAALVVEAHDEGRKARCIDEVNTTIYYKRFSQSHDLSHMVWLAQPHSTLVALPVVHWPEVTRPEVT